MWAEAQLWLVLSSGLEYEPIGHRGSGFVTALVVDPFGNVLGVMHIPNYLEMLARRDRR